MASDYLWFEGIPFPSVGYRTEDLKSVKNEFVVRDGDVIMLSFPKSGTNWLREIISLIYSKGDPNWIRSVPIWDRSPWLETKAGYEQLQKKEGARIYTSHLPIQLFPKSFFDSKAKMIYLLRNPRDVITSGFYFYRILKVCKYPQTFDQYFEWFLQGNVPFGSWFDHCQGWLQMRGKENFFIITYEELHQDLRTSVEKIFQFLGEKLDSKELNSVLKNVSFKAMQDNKMSNHTLIPDTFMDHSQGQLLRKGVTGDWKRHFTVAQSEAFDKIYREKMVGLPPGLCPWGP
ncbi:sulfotransferase 2A1 isoform X1 [Echinops telfairi]|uniref:Sulfotransferase n=1 Tax=Echinops telfairi TaxID=9371 RepID=A0ABM0ZTI7_ECHTE|nr:sulfotransferase 2A1 isoform X1 [Echinops telfairi]